MIKKCLNLSVNGPVEKGINWSNTGSTTKQTIWNLWKCCWSTTIIFQKKIKKKTDNFLVNIFTEEYNYWLVNIAYE